MKNVILVAMFFLVTQPNQSRAGDQDIFQLPYPPASQGYKRVDVQAIPGRGDKIVLGLNFGKMGTVSCGQFAADLEKRTLEPSGAEYYVLIPGQVFGDFGSQCEESPVPTFRGAWSDGPVHTFLRNRSVVIFVPTDWFIERTIFRGSSRPRIL